MRSAKRQVLICALILISTAPALLGCAGGPSIVQIPGACSTLIPSRYRSPVPPADLPLPSASAGDVWTFADAQTGQLEKANGNTADAIEIVERCEKRDQKVIDHLNRPLWRRLLGLGA